jgi:hypothetical protein
MSNQAIDLGQTTSGGGRAKVYTYERDTLIYSQGHPFPAPPRVRDAGGNFMVEHVSKLVLPSTELERKNGGALLFSCKLVPAQGAWSTVPILPAVSSYADEMDALISKGATGWRRARPGNPVANAGQWLAELRDLPTLPLRLLARLRNFRALGSEYLNVQFGWKPFVGDLIKMYEVYQTLDKHLAQLVRDNGRPVRRRRTINTTTDSNSTVIEYPLGITGLRAFYPTPTTFIGFEARSRLVITTKTLDKSWFSGKFRYYVRDIGSSQWTRRATLALFGLNPTPSLLWEVLPWSWLVGYFSNVGDVISNLSSNAVDNLTAEYAYVMRHKKVTTTYTATGWVKPVGTGYYTTNGGDFVSQGTIISETKSRHRGSPYGFGVDFGSLSSYQVSILGALGLSRQRYF